MPFTRHLPPCRGLRAPAPPPEFLSLAQGLGRWVDRPPTPGPTRTASWWSLGKPWSRGRLGRLGPGHCAQGPRRRGRRAAHPPRRPAAGSG